MMKGGVWKERMGGGWKNGAEDGIGAFDRGDEGGRGDLSGGEKTSAAEFDREKGLGTGGICEVSA